MLSGMCAGSVEDGVPDDRKEKAAVKVHVWNRFPGLNSFHSSPLPESFGLSLNCGAYPVDAVVSPLNMNCNIILGVSTSACLCSLSLTFSVLLVSPTYTCGQSLQGISYTTSVCFFSGVLFFTCISSLFRVFIGLKTGFIPRGERPSKSFHLDPCVRGT